MAYSKHIHCLFESILAIKCFVSPRLHKTVGEATNSWDWTVWWTGVDAITFRDKYKLSFSNKCIMIVIQVFLLMNQCNRFGWLPMYKGKQSVSELLILISFMFSRSWNYPWCGQLVPAVMENRIARGNNFNFKNFQPNWLIPVQTPCYHRTLACGHYTGVRCSNCMAWGELGLKLYFHY